ncbi:MAG: hypothetical protein EHM14_06905 [Methanothrix sp.]|nr:MAG: hypothetical protein EHM14_06905 [Methanothrix sp.]
MKNFIISILILFMLVCSCQSLQTVDTSKDSGMAILARITGNSGNQSNTSANNTSANKTSANSTQNQTKQPGSDLWSWGRIPIGYKLEKNGNLTRLADEEWKPSLI